MNKMGAGDYFILHVDSKKQRNESNYELVKDQVYRIEIHKKSEKWKDWIFSSPLTGIKLFILETLFKPRRKESKFLALCGGIGSDFDHIFEIGNGVDQYSSTETGLFYAFANDR